MKDKVDLRYMEAMKKLAGVGQKISQVTGRKKLKLKRDQGTNNPTGAVQEQGVITGFSGSNT